MIEWLRDGKHLIGCFKHAAKHGQAGMSVSPIPACLVDVDQAGSNRNRWDAAPCSVGILVSHFQRPIPPTHTHTYKAARPQAERELSNKNIGRKAASLVGMQNFAWSTRAHHHGNTTSIAKNNLFLLS